jgi:hypothetical protein
MEKFSRFFVSCIFSRHRVRMLCDENMRLVIILIHLFMSLFPACVANPELC